MPGRFLQGASHEAGRLRAVDLAGGFHTSLPFEVGQVIECLYPETNREGVPLKFERRQFVVRKIRDTAIEPVKSPKPGVLRGRFLVLAQDVNKHGWRQFYFDSMWRPVESDIEVFQLGCYEPADETPRYRQVGPVFARDDVHLFKELIDNVNRKLNALNVIKSIAVLRINGRGEGKIDPGVATPCWPRFRHKLY